MKTFRIRGGIHPDYKKELASEQAIEALPLPERLYIPLQQHIGAMGDVVVAVGERVGKGQLLARSYGAFSAAQHAPTSGVVVEITSLPAPHPSGLPQTTVVIEPDGEEAWADLPGALADPFAAPPEAIRARVAECGIVGMGGAAFPAAVKLDLGLRYPLDTLIINGAECEPYLTCDDRIMRERADEVADGGRLMAHALGVDKVLIAIEENKPQAIERMREATASVQGRPGVAVVPVPVQYPMGSERHLVLAVTGRETPARKLTAEVGVVVNNVATARAVHQAIRHGRPLTARVVTVSGGAIRQPKNVEVPIGTRIADVVAFCGGFSSEPARLVNGGPMMGQPLPGLEVPIVKGSSGVLALTAAELHAAAPNPCIRCGNCVSICPCGLVPVEMAANIRHDKLDVAERLGVGDCMSCGSCSWVCPSHIPLVQFFNFAKGALAAEQREARKQEQIRVRAEARTARLDREAAERKAAMAARKAAAAKPNEVRA